MPSHPIQVPKEAQMEAFQPAPAGMAKVRMGQKTDLPTWQVGIRNCKKP